MSRGIVRDNVQQFKLIKSMELVNLRTPAQIRRRFLGLCGDRALAAGRQSLNRYTKPRPVSPIVEIRRSERVVGPRGRLNRGGQFAAVLIIFEGMGAVLVTPGLLLRVAPQARDCAVEPHLEITKLIDIGGSVRRKEFDEPAEDLIAHNPARERFRLTVGAFRARQAA